MRQKVKPPYLLVLLAAVFLIPSGFASAVEESKDAPKAQESPKEAAPKAGESKTVSDAELGKKVYEKRCTYCHGDNGKGDGPAADFFTPRPRDFTSGLYKYRSTPTGKMPRDPDLLKTIGLGLPGTGMPGWEDVLNEKERTAVAQYIKTFSKRFARLTEAPAAFTVGKKTAVSKESIARGKELYQSLECFKCHGDEGRGDGPSAPDLKDDFGYPVQPRNLTRKWYFRGGHEPDDIYLRVNTGLAGTPMPSFDASLDNNKSWELANFVISLSPARKPDLKFVVKAKRIPGELPENPDDPLWDGLELFEYPMVGQVIEDPRNFAAIPNDMDVKAAYNDKEFAIRLVWDDPTPSVPNAEKGTYADAVAVQFPNKPTPGAGKPFFLMGDAENPVNLWKWKSDSDKLTETNAWGMNKEIEQPAASQGLKGKGLYSHGQYRLVLKRSLKTPDVQNDLQFDPEKFIPIAFNTWDGSAGESGKKKSISAWYDLYLEAPEPPTVYVYPTVFAVIAVGLEWWIVRKSRSYSREQKTGKQSS